MASGRASRRAGAIGRVAAHASGKAGWAGLWAGGRTVCVCVWWWWRGWVDEGGGKDGWATGPMGQGRGGAGER